MSGKKRAISFENLVFCCLAVLLFCHYYYPRDDEKEYEYLLRVWEKERAVALKEWKSSLTISSRGPSYDTKSYTKLVSKSAKLIPFLIRRIKGKRTQEEYGHYMSLFVAILKIRFELEFLKDEGKLLLVDYDIKYLSRIDYKLRGKEEDFIYEYELWWDQGRSRTPEVFAKKYQAYSDARNAENTEEIARTFELLQNMGIIILPNILGKIEEGDETLLPMFVYLSGEKTLKTVADCHQWWEKNKEDYKIVLDY